jgi:hypothetical protein
MSSGGGFFFNFFPDGVGGMDERAKGEPDNHGSVVCVSSSFAPLSIQEVLRVWSRKGAARFFKTAFLSE